MSYPAFAIRCMGMFKIWNALVPSGGSALNAVCYRQLLVSHVSLP